MFADRLAAPLLALAIALVAPRAHAQAADDVTRARELFVEGAKLAEEGSWEAARDRFSRSLKHKRAAITLYNLGVAQQETGHHVQAVESFRAFLAMPVEPATQGYVAPVKAALAKLEARVGEIQIEVRPAGVSGVALRLDGRDVSGDKGPWVVEPGRHEIVAVAPGHAETRQTASVGQGGKASVVIALTPSAPSQTVPIALGVAGLTLFVGGEVVFGVGAAKSLDFQADRGAAKNAMIAGNVIAGAGAIAAGIGLVLLLRRPRSDAQKAAVLPWSSGHVVGVQARF